MLHTAARGENVTCILLNNGVFGETGGHMTATSVIGQRTKNSLDGRDAEYHGYPILIGDLIAQLQGAVAEWDCEHFGDFRHPPRHGRDPLRCEDVQREAGAFLVQPREQRLN